MRTRRPLRIVVLGAPKVGKTVTDICSKYNKSQRQGLFTDLCEVPSYTEFVNGYRNVDFGILETLTVRYLTQRFIGEYCSRGDVVYRHTLIIRGEKADIEILDTCKPTIYRREGDGYLVVFSVTEPSSLAAAAGILACLPPTRPVLLLANKTDLDQVRSVSVRAGLELSVLAGCPYLEVSAASGDRCGIALAFGALASRVKPQAPIRSILKTLMDFLTYARKPQLLCANKIKWK